MKNVRRDRVIQKMREFDRKGAKAFFKKYGGGPARRYHLVDPADASKIYPPAAILQAALDWEDVRGGKSGTLTANSILERADFEIVDDQSVGGAERIVTAKLNKEYFDGLAAITVNQKQAIVSRRVGQNLFRSELLRRTDDTCEVTGIRDRELIRASHIRPWGKCNKPNDRRRLDPENGIALSSLWDCAFDSGLVSFEDDGSILYSSKLSNAARSLLTGAGVRSIKVSPAKAKYLKYHRTKHFKP